MLRRICSIGVLSCFLIGAVSFCPVVASETTKPEPITLTMQQAIDMSLKNSRTLKQAEYDITKGEKVQKKASERVTFTPLSPSNSPAQDAAFTSLVMADINYLMATKSKTVEEDKIVYSAINNYTKLLEALENKEYTSKNRAITSKQTSISELSYQQGLISKTQLDQAKAALNNANLNMKNADLQLDNAYLNLNNLVGFQVTDRPLLKERPNYSELIVDNVETEVSRTLDGSPAVWLAEQKAKLSNIELNLFDFSGGSSYDAAKIDVQKASLSAVDTKEQMRNSIRGIYNSAKQLEEALLMQQEAQKLAVEKLRVTKAMYEAGTATQIQVQTDELALLKADNDLIKTTNQHELAKIAFRKPWSAGASQ